jgi:hypothetical protein
MKLPVNLLLSASHTKFLFLVHKSPGASKMASASIQNKTKEEGLLHGNKQLLSTSRQAV